MQIDMKKNEMFRVVLLTTGGTIASEYDPASGLWQAGKTDSKNLLQKLNLADQKDLCLEIKNVYDIDSSMMRFKMVIDLVHLMYEYVNTARLTNQIIDAFIITHGTDSMEETAYLISILWREKIPVVITGSQIGPDEAGSDAYKNLHGALVLAKNKYFKEYGVVLFFNDQFFDPRFVRKTHASNVNAFTSLDSASLGIVDGNDVYFFTKNMPVTSYELPHEDCEPARVALLFEHMDMCEELYEAVHQSFLTGKIQGLVIEGFGRGHIGEKSAIKVLSMLKDKLPIVMTSACYQGAVKEIYNFEGAIAHLIKHGAINAHLHQAKKARLKLQLLLTLRHDENSSWFGLEHDEFLLKVKENFNF